MKVELNIFLILACLLGAGLAKPMVASKILLALNCGTKDQVVESFDKIFKYQPVLMNLFRTNPTFQVNQSMSTITLTMKPNNQILSINYTMQIYLRQAHLHVRETHL
jgi:energy-converting hydrogenase Eha subunit G